MVSYQSSNIYLLGPIWQLTKLQIASFLCKIRKAKWKSKINPPCRHKWGELGIDHCHILSVLLLILVCLTNLIPGETGWIRKSHCRPSHTHSSITPVSGTVPNVVSSLDQINATSSIWYLAIDLVSNRWLA